MNRLHMLTAVLTKRAHVDVAADDIYVNVVGGLRLVEPAVDLAIITAIYSSRREVPIGRTVVIGEVGLAGEVRRIQNLRRRLQEAQKLGIERAIVPRQPLGESLRLPPMDIKEVTSVTDALEAASSGHAG